jgi:hypothetical protein
MLKSRVLVIITGNNCEKYIFASDHNNFSHSNKDLERIKGDDGHADNQPSIPNEILPLK